MNCPGCNHPDWEYPDVAIARCKNCGYFLDPYVIGMKSDSANANLNRSENSLRWAKVALGVSIVLFGVSIFVPDWEGIWGHWFGCKWDFVVGSPTISLGGFSS